MTEIKSSCPYCGSENVMRCEMVHLQGTQSGYMLGGAITSDDIIPAGGITSSQSSLASFCQPPPAPALGSNIGGVLGFVLGALGVAGLFAAYPTDVWFTARIPVLIYILMAALIVGGSLAGQLIGGIVGADTDKKLQWNRIMQDWRKEWVCVACGKKWIPTVRAQPRVVGHRFSCN